MPERAAYVVARNGFQVLTETFAAVFAGATQALNTFAAVHCAWRRGSDTPGYDAGAMIDIPLPHMTQLLWLMRYDRQAACEDKRALPMRQPQRSAVDIAVILRPIVCAGDMPP